MDHKTSHRLSWPQLGPLPRWRHCSVQLTAGIVVVSVLGIAKWFVPAVLGTGDIYTLGTWIEEIVLVGVFGVLSRMLFGRNSYALPIVYFFVAYVLHAPVYFEDKFRMIVLAFGFVTVVVMLLGILVVEAVRLVLDQAWPFKE